MALTHNGLVIGLSTKDYPQGYIPPAVTTFEDNEFIYQERVFTVLKSGVSDPSDATTFTNLVAQINTDIQTLLNADVDTTTLTVESFGRLKSITSNNAGTTSTDFYTSTATSYQCAVDVLVKTV